MSIMHTYTLAILLFLLVTSFIELPYPISVEARKLVSSKGGVFKADLIHRDSPLSPYYNPSITLKERLKRSPLGSISRGHKIHNLSSSYYGTINDTKSYDDLISNDGEYLMKFSLGTPKVEFIAIVDTGSDLIWVQCSPCTHCIHQNSSLFDPIKSSTYQLIPCSSSACYHRDLHSGCPSNNNNNSVNESSPCLYEISYGDETRSNGYLATETIILPSFDDTTISTSLPSLRFGCGFNQNGSLNGGDGIIGLGTGPSSLISQLGPSINHKFSYCLTQLSSNVSSKLAFGADVIGTGVVSTPYTTGVGSAHYYNLSLNGIGIGSPKDTPVLVPMDLQVIIDSGTTLTYLLASVYSSLKAALASAIELRTVPSPLEPYDLCYNSDAQFNPPNVVFHFKGANVVLKAINTFREIGDGVTCLAMAATNGTSIFGNIAQVNFHIGYDLIAKEVSFVPTDCTKF